MDYIIKKIALAVAKANFISDDYNTIVGTISWELAVKNNMPVTSDWQAAHNALGCDEFAVKEEVFRGYVVTKSNAVHEVRVLCLMKAGSPQVVYKLSVSGVEM